MHERKSKHYMILGRTMVNITYRTLTRHKVRQWPHALPNGE